MRAYRLQLALVGVLAIVVTATDFASAQSNKNSPYNHHDSAEYRELDAVSRTQLDQVVKDFATLEEAFKGYMDDHDGQPPESLGDLVPKYVKALPQGPIRCSRRLRVAHSRWCQRRCRQGPAS